MQKSSSDVKAIYLCIVREQLIIILHKTVCFYAVELHFQYTKWMY